MDQSLKLRKDEETSGLKHFKTYENSQHWGTSISNFEGQISDSLVCSVCIYIYTLWLFNIAMENGPFIDDKHDDLPNRNGDFPVRYVK